MTTSSLHNLFPRINLMRKTYLLVIRYMLEIIKINKIAITFSPFIPSYNIRLRRLKKRRGFEVRFRTLRKYILIEYYNNRIAN